MNADTLPIFVAPRAERPGPKVAGVTAAMLAMAGVVGSAVMVLPGWIAMWVIAMGLFFALKLIVLRGHWRGASPERVAAFLLLWPGMNAGAFLARKPAGGGVVSAREVAFASGKLALGLGLAGWAVGHADTGSPLVVGSVGMLGIIFTFHFGLFHVVSCAWRAVGVDAPPIMRAPIAARSLAEFWGERWNIAFAEAARRLLLRPVARRWGVARAGAVVFVVSGIAHELVISVPAHGGWGGPTLYFLLQGMGMALEKSALGRALGLGAGWVGRGWTLACTALPVPLLFHAPFAERVIVPLFRFLKEVL
jgi:alginate O-acetyltransferase complex protein AlgI